MHRWNDKSRAFFFLIILLISISTPIFADNEKPATADKEIRNIESISLYSSEAARQKVKGYTHGNYALDLLGTFYFLLIVGVLAFSGASSRLRDFCLGVLKKRGLAIFLYWALFFFILTLLTLPLDYYRQFYREHLYGFSQQSFSSWFGDYVKGFVIGLLFGGLFIVVLYWVFRKSPKRWWVWGAAVAIAFVILSAAVVPEFIAPLFNKYEPIKNQELRAQVLALAEAHGIHPKDVYEVNASKQSNKIGAFVFGLLGTQRIVLTDTLIQRCSAREILVVVGHEMGHYIMNHVWIGIAFFAVLIFVFGYLLQLIIQKLIRKYENRLGFREVSDIASLPLLLFIFSLLFFVFSPLSNTFSRHLEAEADWYGLASTGYWLAEIEVDKKLGEYREMDPHPVVEFLFFDHPSGKNRIKMALEYRDKYGNKPILPH